MICSWAWELWWRRLVKVAEMGRVGIVDGWIVRFWDMKDVR